MGVGVSLGGLAGAVAACGGMGTISTADAGYQEPDFPTDPAGANLRALEKQVRRAKELAHGAGMVAVNAMVATTQYAQSVRTALRAGVDAVVCGAGLPKDLPAIAAEVPVSNAALAPIVSSGRAAALICRLWDKHHHRIPDFVVLEGPLAGGHLGFSPEEAKVITLWQVLLLLFLVCTVAGMVGTFSSTVQEAMFSPDSLDGYRTFYVCGALQTFAPVLFPSLPLLITGSMGKDRALWILGLVCLLLGVWGMLQFFFPYASFLLLFNLPLTLWQTLQGPIALLVTARRLRMKGA